MSIESFSGVRPLFDDNAANPSAVTRDYVFDIDAPSGVAPMLSVFGGKITTYRKLAEHALEKLKPHFPEMGAPWTEGAVLPGGDLPGADFEAWFAGFRSRQRLAAARDRARLRASIRRPRERTARRRQIADRSRALLRRRPLRARGALSDGGGMGDDRRGHRHAPDQTRPAHVAHGAGDLHRLDSRGHPMIEHFRRSRVAGSARAVGGAGTQPVPHAGGRREYFDQAQWRDVDQSLRAPARRRHGPRHHGSRRARRLEGGGAAKEWAPVPTGLPPSIPARSAASRTSIWVFPGRPTTAWDIQRLYPGSYCRTAYCRDNSCVITAGDGALSLGACARPSRN